MTITLEKLKLFLRIDGNYEDELLQDFIDTAAAYLQGAISNFDEKYQYSEFATKADRVQLVIAAEMYQNRDSRNDSRTDYSFTIRSMISQLQYFVAPLLDVATYTTTASTGTTYTTTSQIGGEPP